MDVYDAENQDTVPMEIFRRKDGNETETYCSVLTAIKEKDEKNQSRCQWLRHIFEYKDYNCIITNHPFGIIEDQQPKALSTFILEKSNVQFCNRQVQSFARKLFKSVAFLHEHGIVHTRLEPNNIFLCPHSRNSQQKVVSSSTAKNHQQKGPWSLLKSKIQVVVLEGAIFESKRGYGEPSPGHLNSKPSRHTAPEVFLGKQYSSSCDIWSIGCIIFEIITGVPFVIEATSSNDGEDDVLDMDDQNFVFLRAIKERLEDNNDESSISIRPYKDLLGKCTGDCIDLLENIFKLSSRITAAEALQHPWLSLGKLSSAELRQP